MTIPFDSSRRGADVPGCASIQTSEPGIARPINYREWKAGRGIPLRDWALGARPIPPPSEPIENRAQAMLARVREILDGAENLEEAKERLDAMDRDPAASP